MALRYTEKPTSRSSKALSVGDAIKEMLKIYQLQGKFNETFVVAHWEKIMGKTIANRTEKVYFKDKRMFVKVNSSALKKDLMLSKQNIINLVNSEMGDNVVDDVVFL